VLSRRNLITTLVGAAWLSGRTSLAASLEYLTPSLSACDNLAKLCSDLRCAGPIGKACLRALPETEMSLERLAPLILVEVSSSGRDLSSVIALRQAVREQTRDDFRNKKILNVDGWVLSLTESRVYAMAALLQR
jgi:hypothetical protein